MSERPQPDLSEAERNIQNHLKAEERQREVDHRRRVQKSQRRNSRMNKAVTVGGITALGLMGAAAVEFSPALDPAHDTASAAKTAGKVPGERQPGQTPTEGPTDQDTASPETTSPDSAVTSSVELNSPTSENRTVVIAPEASSSDTGSQTGGVAAERPSNTGGVDGDAS